MATIQELESFKLSDAVAFHKELNPKLWEDEKLDPTVRDQLLLIAEDFVEYLGISNLKVRDVTISGSNAAYSYTPHSDLDLHVLVDFNELPNNEVYQELFTAKKTLYNEAHDITVRDVPVELYVQDTSNPVQSLGEYSIVHDKWIRIPKKRRANFDEVATKAKYEKLGDLIELAIKSKDPKRVNDTIALVKRYRKSGLDKAGEFGPENLAYKAVRKQGLVQALHDLKAELHGEKLSIEEDADKQAATLKIQKHLNKKYGANLDLDGKLGPLTLKSINKFMPRAKTGLADEPNKTTAVQGKKLKETESKPTTSINFRTWQRGGVPKHSFVVVRNGEEIAYGEIAKDNEWEDDRGASVQEIVVHPNYRRKGFATKIYNEIERRFNYKLHPSDDVKPDGQAFWKARGNLGEASGYIPSAKEKNDPRFKTALTVDVTPNSNKDNAKAFGWKVSRAGIPPQANPNGKVTESTNRTLPHKSLETVTSADVVNAMLSIDDLRASLEVDWYDILGDQDLPGDITDTWQVDKETFKKIADYYAPAIHKIKRLLLPISNQSNIPVTRRFAETPTGDLGIHWSYGKEHNPITAGRGKNVVSGTINTENVDWITTVTRALHWWDTEKEITPVSSKFVDTQAQTDGKIAEDLMREFKTFLSESALPKIGYHVTATKNLPIIQKNGIKADKRGSSYVWDSREMAEWFMDFQNDEGQDRTILKIDMSGLDANLDPEAEDMSEWSSKFKPGTNGGAWIISGPIPSDKIIG